jgi:glutamine cyclotransferase
MHRAARAHVTFRFVAVNNRRFFRAVRLLQDPHARDAFTEGLLYAGGWLYESTGLEGTSSLRRVELETGHVDEQAALPSNVFGEGLALVGHELYQLSYRSGRGFIWDLDSLTLLREFSYQGEGWGFATMAAIS